MIGWQEMISMATGQETQIIRTVGQVVIKGNPNSLILNPFHRITIVADIHHRLNIAKMLGQPDHFRIYLKVSQLTVITVQIGFRCQQICCKPAFGDQILRLFLDF